MRSEFTRTVDMELTDGYTARVQVTVFSPQHPVDQRRDMEKATEERSQKFVDTLQSIADGTR